MRIGGDCADKTGFIKELLSSWAEVNLITRPRRFGKSLNMDMLGKVINEEAIRFQRLMESTKLTQYGKKQFEHLLNGNFDKKSGFNRQFKAVVEASSYTL